MTTLANISFRCKPSLALGASFDDKRYSVGDLSSPLVWTFMYQEVHKLVLIQFIWCSLCFLYLGRYLFQEIFFYDFLDNIFCTFNFGFFSSLYSYYS